MYTVGCHVLLMLIFTELWMYCRMSLQFGVMFCKVLYLQNDVYISESCFIGVFICTTMIILRDELYRMMNAMQSELCSIYKMMIILRNGFAVWRHVLLGFAVTEWCIQFSAVFYWGLICLYLQNNESIPKWAYQFSAMFYRFLYSRNNECIAEWVCSLVPCFMRFCIYRMVCTFQGHVLLVFVFTEWWMYCRMNLQFDAMFYRVLQLQNDVYISVSCFNCV